MKNVKICGYAQNCYKVDGSFIPSKTAKPNIKQEKYESLEKVVLPNGYIEEVVQKDYPINAESVSSMAEGADYRNDPMQAIAGAPNRVNLGDVTEAQKFLENPQNFARVFDIVKQRLTEYQAQQAQQTQQAQQQNGGNDE